MQDTRANMGAHLKWDIPMFLGIASTKDGRLRLMIALSQTATLRVLRRFFDIFRSFVQACSLMTANKRKEKEKKKEAQTFGNLFWKFESPNVIFDNLRNWRRALSLSKQRRLVFRSRI